MADKPDPRVNEEAQFQVSGLESGQVLGGDLSIKIARLDSRILSQVVNNLQIKITQVTLEELQEMAW